MKKRVLAILFGRMYGEDAAAGGSTGGGGDSLDSPAENISEPLQEEQEEWEMDADPMPSPEILPEEQEDVSEPVALADAPTPGTCGTKLTWNLDGEGTLTISGSGDMAKAL